MCVDPRLLEKSMMGIFLCLSTYGSLTLRLSPLISPLLLVLPPFSDHSAHTSLPFFLLPFHFMTNIKTI